MASLKKDKQEQMLWLLGRSSLASQLAKQCNRRKHRYPELANAAAELDRVSMQEFQKFCYTLTPSASESK